LFVSPALERQRDAYYDGLLRVSTEGDFLGWIRFFIEVVGESAAETLDRLDRLRALREEFEARLGALQSQKPAQLLPQLFGLPYVTVPLAKAFLGVESATARQAIEKLVVAEILEEVGDRPKPGRGRPARLYRCPAILDIVRE
jgi:Fic family protein